MLMLGEKAQWKVIYLEFSLNSFLRRNSLSGNSTERRNLEKYLVYYFKGEHFCRCECDHTLMVMYVTILIFGNFKTSRSPQIT